MAGCHSLSLTLLFVVDERTVEEVVGSSGEPSDTVHRAMERKGRRYLEHAMWIASDYGVECRQRLRRGQLHSQIAAAVRELGADLVVVGDARSRGSHRATLGSITESILEYTSCSVLTVRGPSES
jgi:nucleotide-binding universal stress UspA family protein